MANRRSLGDAITMTPDKMAFIQGAKSTPEVPTPVITKPMAAASAPVHAVANPDQHEADRPEDSAISRTVELPRAHARRTRGRNRSERESSEQTLPLGTANLMAPITTRLRPATAAALKRAGLEQRLRGAEPATVQEIVEIAVAEWLEQHDYL